jgi:hypothetical protein
VPRRAISSGPQNAVGSGPQTAPGYDQGASGAYPTYDSADGNRPAWPGAADQQGFGTQQASSRDYGQSGFTSSGYDQPGADQRGFDQQGHNQQGYPQQGYDQQGYGRSGSGYGSGDYEQPGYGTGRSRAFGESDQSYPGQNTSGYGTEAYPQQGFDRPGYSQNGYADHGPGQSQSQGGYNQEAGYGLNALGQPVAPSGTGYPQDGYGQGSYSQDPYGHNGTQDPYGHNGSQDSYGQNGAQATYSPDAYTQSGYGQEGYQQEGYRQDAYGTGGYSAAGQAPDAHGQPGYEQPGYDQPGGPPYGHDDFAAPGQSPRSGSSRSAQRSPQRLGGIRMVLYLLSSVVGVVVIVLLVVHLTKAGTNSGASAGSTPSTGSTAPAAGGAATKYVFTQATKAGPYTLNSSATRATSQLVKTPAATIASEIKAKGAGTPGKDVVVAVYNLTSVTDTSSSDFKAVDFLGFDGTFKPSAVIKYEQTQLVSTRLVPAGPHGGEMMCGYSRANGPETSECVWATTSTFGQVEFTIGQTLAKFNGASSIAQTVRNAVEIPAS